MTEQLTMRNECYYCDHMRKVLGDAHIQCAKPDKEMAGDEHGKKNGWFHYPVLFDPTWKLTKCRNFAEGTEEPGKEKPGEEEHIMMQAIAAILHEILPDGYNFVTFVRGTCKDPNNTFIGMVTDLKSHLHAVLLVTLVLMKERAERKDAEDDS